jgi:hypothetical protein
MVLKTIVVLLKRSSWLSFLLMINLDFIFVNCEVTVHTRHWAIKYLMNSKDAKPRLIRWILLLEKLNLHIVVKKGEDDFVDDYLSRMENIPDDHIPIDCFHNELVTCYLHFNFLVFYFHIPYTPKYQIICIFYCTLLPKLWTNSFSSSTCKMVL